MELHRECQCRRQPNDNRGLPDPAGACLLFPVQAIVDRSLIIFAIGASVASTDVCTFRRNLRWKNKRVRAGAGVVTAAGGLWWKLPARLHADRRTTITEDRLPLNELLQKAGDGDFFSAVL